MSIPRSPGLKDAKALTAFLPRLRATPSDAVEEWCIDGGIVYPIYAQWATDFFEQTSRDCWYDPGYDVLAAGGMLDDDERIAKASLNEIKAMLTYFVRGERFCDGLQAGLIRQGRIAALVSRIQEIYGITDAD